MLALVSGGSKITWSSFGFASEADLPSPLPQSGRSPWQAHAPYAVPDPALSRGGVACSGLGRRLCLPQIPCGLRVAPLQSLYLSAHSFPGVPLGTFRSWPPCFGLRSGHGLQLLSSRLEFRVVSPPPVFIPVFLLGPLRGRSPGSAPGPATCRGRWASPPLRGWVFSRPDFVGLTKRSHQTSPESRG